MTSYKKAETSYDKSYSRLTTAKAKELVKEKAFDSARSAVGDAKHVDDKVKKVEKELIAAKAYAKAKHSTDKVSAKTDKSLTRLKTARGKLPKLPK